MMSSIATTTLAIATNFLLLVEGAHGQEGPPPPINFHSFIGVNFFKDGSNGNLEASGMDISPDGSHLVVASDNGKLIFLNLLDYESGHCLVDIDEDLSRLIKGGTDFEGVAFDPADWDESNMHVYVIHEGAKGDDPYLNRISYTYDNDGTCAVSAIDSVSLGDAIPCLPTSNGIESLALKSESTVDNPAVFFVGIQDTGKVHEITSTGLSNGPNCYDGGLDYYDIADSYYIEEKGHLWSFFDKDYGKLAVIDPFSNRKLASYDTNLKDEEGLAIDYDNGLMYIASDQGGSGGVSYVAIYNFTYPEGIGGCSDGVVSTASCSSLFTDCGVNDANPIIVASTCPQSQATTTTGTVASTTVASTSTATTAATTTAATTAASTTAATTAVSTTAATTTSATTTIASTSTTTAACIAKGDLCAATTDCCGTKECKGRRSKAKKCS